MRNVGEAAVSQPPRDVCGRLRPKRATLERHSSPSRHGPFSLLNFHTQGGHCGKGYIMSARYSATIEGACCTTSTGPVLQARRQLWPDKNQWRTKHGWKLLPRGDMKASHIMSFIPEVSRYWPASQEVHVHVENTYFFILMHRTTNNDEEAQKPRRCLCSWQSFAKLKQTKTNLYVYCCFHLKNRLAYVFHWE